MTSLLLSFAIGYAFGKVLLYAWICIHPTGRIAEEWRRLKQ